MRRALRGAAAPGGRSTVHGAGTCTETPASEADGSAAAAGRALPGTAAPVGREGFDAPVPRDAAAADEDGERRPLARPPPGQRRRRTRNGLVPYDEAADGAASGHPHRGTIALEEAEVLRHEHHRAGQHVLRLLSPAVAARAAPGSFVHLRCGPALAMRRPMSVMRAEPVRGWFEVLFKEVGAGTRRLGQRGPGERVSVLGPIGRGFAPSPTRPHRLLIGGGVGIPPILFLAERLAASRPIVLAGSEVPFPFDLRPSVLSEPGLPAAGAGLGCLEDLAIPSRTASRAGLPGCHGGLVTDLARAWLEARSSGAGVELFACGPAPMLRAVARLGMEFGVPSRIALEEYMACGTGGCAGCTVLVRGPGGPAMKRVCVDGPVFDGASVSFGDQ